MGKFCLCVFHLMLALWVIPAHSFGRHAGDKGRLTIIITPVFNGKPIKLSDQYYVNHQGDTLYIDLFRFYVTNMKLTGASRTVADLNSHLIDAEDTATRTLHVDNVTAGSYTSIQFTAGVDSVANTSGANGGDLDPAKGMFWAWNTGYVMAKLEGRSAACNTLHHAFEFHIGGYMPPNNTARQVTLALQHPIEIRPGGNTIVNIKADAAAWFKGSGGLAQLNSVVIPGKAASLIADNYAQMFSITESEK
jgi:hypothetical protein